MMGMDGTFIERLALEVKEPVNVHVDEQPRVALPPGWTIAAERFDEVKPLGVHTLTGLGDYIHANIDGRTLGSLMLHVVTHERVELIEKLESEEKRFRRSTLLVASSEAAKFSFGQFMEAEAFTIGLQTAFVDSPERADIIRLVASIKESSVREVVDSGVAQEVKVAGGVTLVGAANLPNPVSLAPYRTFREVEQPASSFVLRAKAGSGADGTKPALALFEADGGTWKLEAISRVAAWLREHAAEVKVIA